jgi:hypothetical protein
MRKDLKPQEKKATVFDPNQEAAQYLSAMADTHGGEGSPTAAYALTGEESIQEIIDIAIGLEMESILFYLGLKDFVPPDLGRISWITLSKKNGGISSSSTVFEKSCSYSGCHAEVPIKV